MTKLPEQKIHEWVQCSFSKDEFQIAMSLVLKTLAFARVTIGWPARGNDIAGEAVKEEKDGDGKLSVDKLWGDDVKERRGHEYKIGEGIGMAHLYHNVKRLT